MATIKLFSRRAAVLLVAACSLCAAAQTEQTVEEEVAKDSKKESIEGFNALEYVLQKPNKNRFFEKKRFFDRVFVALEGGASWFMNPEDIFEIPQTDVRIGAMIGDWVTPVHGWRLGLNAGRHNIDGIHRSAFGGVSLDYMANLSSLVRGYDTKRKFDVVGTVGVEFQMNNHCASFYNMYGLRAGLQARWYATNSMYLYLEPRIGAYFGPATYQDLTNNSYYHYRIEPSVMFGIGMRKISAEEREANSDPFEANNFAENMFYEAGAGWTNLVRENGKFGMFSGKNLTFAFSGGKWFNAYSALRLTATYGKLTQDQEFVMGGLDYVWNITSSITGYRVYRPFEINLALGVAGAYVNDTKAKIYPGFRAGLKAMVNINSNWGIFVEPQASVFMRDFKNDTNTDEILTSVNVGLRYTIGDYKFDYAENLAEFKAADTKRQFAIGSIGAAKYSDGQLGIGGVLELGYGRWFSPMSAWKVGIDAQLFPRSYGKYRSISFGGDYILSISSALCGFNPDRFFDFSGSLGAYAGIARLESIYFKDPQIRPTASAKAAFIGSFRVNENWSIQLQTQAIAAALPLAGSGFEYRPEMRLMLGTRYQF